MKPVSARVECNSVGCIKPPKFVMRCYGCATLVCDEHALKGWRATPSSDFSLAVIAIKNHIAPTKEEQT